jgi:cell division protein FtsW (lipid II flippase)
VKVIDVAALVILIANAIGALVAAARGGWSTWRSAQRWSAGSTAALALAGLVGGALPVGAAVQAVAAVWLIGWGWVVAARWLPPSADPVVARCSGTLIGVGLILQGRLVGAIDQPVVIVAVGSMLGVAAAVSWRRLDPLFDHGAALLLAGLVLYSVAAMLTSGRLAALPGPAGAVQVGDLARLLVLMGTGLTVANEPLRMSTVHRGTSGFRRGAPVITVLGPISVAWVTALVLAALTRDFGGAALLFVELVVVLTAVTGRLWPIVIAVPMLIGAGVVATRFTGHIQERVQIWLHPEQLPAGHQHVLAMSAWTDGGWWGLGLGGGRPLTVPAIRSDYILAAVGEELGAVGGLALVALVAAVVIVAARLAARSDPRQSVLALAVGVFLAFQAVAVVLGSSGALPLTGIPFPWLSHGGSALLVNTLAGGMLIGISGAARRSAPAVSGSRTPVLEGSE